MVPSLVIKLDETDVPFRQSARKKAVGRKSARSSCVVAVKIEHALLCPGPSRNLWDRGPPAGRPPISRTALIDFRIAQTVQLHLVRVGQAIQKLAARLGRRSGRI